MHLIDLDPFWLIRDGKRVGFSFISPTDPARRQIVTIERIQVREQWALTNAARADSAKVSQTGGFAWTINGGASIEDADFRTLTVSPSVDGSAGGLWHGFITAGEIR